MNRTLRWFDTITLNIYFLGLTTLSQTNGLILPLLVQQFIGEEQKATYYGRLRLWTLMVALLSQALMGLLSDHSTLRWGRRRPFIFTGTLLDLAFLTVIGFSAGMQSLTGFWFLFTIAIFLQVSSNMAQAAQQGLIPDLVPESQRGRYSGIKVVMELPIPMLVVAFTVGRLVAAGHTWAGILVAMGVLVLVMLATMLVPEQPLLEKPPTLDWAPFLRLALMTGVFTLIILGSGAATKTLGGWLGQELQLGQGLLIAVMGMTGLAAMIVTIWLGVWVSIRLSIGEEAARRNPSFTWWVVNRLSFLVGTVNLSTFAIYFLQARLGYVKEKAAAPASILIMLVGVFILLSALPSGWLADRFGRKSLTAISGGLAALGTLVALLLPNLTIIYVGGCLIGVATGLFYAANWALGTDLVPKEQAGRFLGLSNLAGAGAGAIGAYIGGPIADYITANLPQIPGLGYIILFSIYGTLFLFSTLALRGIQQVK